MRHSTPEGRAALALARIAHKSKSKLRALAVSDRITPRKTELTEFHLQRDPG
jgi:hypothetical protein